MATVTTPLRIGPADRGRAMTLEEFLDADVKEGYRYELARGVLEVNQVANDPHGDVVCNLYRGVARYDERHPGMIHSFGGGSEFQFIIPGLASGRNPDLGVVLRGAPRDWRGRRLPALAAEVVSRGSITRDYQAKREEYLAYGLLEYWIVDPMERKVTVLTRRGDIWSEAVFRGDQVIASLVLPGFATTVAELWVGVNEAEDEDDAAGDGSRRERCVRGLHDVGGGRGLGDRRPAPVKEPAPACDGPAAGPVENVRSGPGGPAAGRGPASPGAGGRWRARPIARGGMSSPHGAQPARRRLALPGPPHSDDQTDQSSITSPGTRAKSRRLRVTTINRFARAVAAIFRSRVPMRTCPKSSGTRPRRAGRRRRTGNWAKSWSVSASSL